MICINCSHPSTTVSNSRPHKSSASVWRRRQCLQCTAIFTTLEHPDLRYTSLNVESGVKEFNIGKLIISIANAFQHDRQKGVDHAAAIANTVMTRLSLRKDLDRQAIAATTHETLERFDGRAAAAYALQHAIK